MLFPEKTPEESDGIETPLQNRGLSAFLVRINQDISPVLHRFDENIPVRVGEV